MSVIMVSRATKAEGGLCFESILHSRRKIKDFRAKIDIFLPPRSPHHACGAVTMATNKDRCFQ
jgi:hypothetical protein